MQNCFFTINDVLLFFFLPLFFKSSEYTNRQKTCFGSINLINSLLMILKPRSSKCDMKQSKQRAGYASRCAGAGAWKRNTT